MGVVSVSIVSHHQGELLHPLLLDLVSCPEVGEILVTNNVVEPLPPSLPGMPRIIQNTSPQGFAANHNAAFGYSSCDYFAVVNPDIRLCKNPFPSLMAACTGASPVVSAPAVLNNLGELEDSIRHFPTPLTLVGKLLGYDHTRVRIRVGSNSMEVPWAGGMFLLMKRADFGDVGGFDPNFFLYYEDVDLCARVWHAGGKVLVTPEANVIHDARRTSRKNLRYLYLHIRSVIRYLCKHWGRLPNLA